MKSRSLLLALVVALSGCVQYVPADVSELRPDDKVRLQLEDAELAKLLAFADASDRSVTGRFVASTGDSLSVVLRTPAAYTQVSIPRRSIVRLNRGVPDNRKNFIMSAALVGGVAALAVAGFEGRDQGPIGDGSGIDETRVSFFGFRIPFSLGLGR